MWSHAGKKIFNTTPIDALFDLSSCPAENSPKFKLTTSKAQLLKMTKRAIICKTPKM